ncbi:hypothetical protein [Vreelandella utahensis]|uniref:hypothetical protein n=1 Tax=Vreelandella halophila TaxID=86177 RepID=UPI00117B1DF4|nr:hypothetical protein [Halomonas utahensis]
MEKAKLFALGFTLALLISFLLNGAPLIAITHFFYPQATQLASVILSPICAVLTLILTPKLKDYFEHNAT